MTRMRLPIWRVERLLFVATSKSSSLPGHCPKRIPPRWKSLVLICISRSFTYRRLSNLASHNFSSCAPSLVTWGMLIVPSLHAKVRSASFLLFRHFSWRHRDRRSRGFCFSDSQPSSFDALPTVRFRVILFSSIRCSFVGASLFTWTFSYWRHWLTARVMGWGVRFSQRVIHGVKLHPKISLGITAMIGVDRDSPDLTNEKRL